MSGAGSVGALSPGQGNEFNFTFTANVSVSEVATVRVTTQGSGHVVERNVTVTSTWQCIVVSYSAV